MTTRWALPEYIEDALPAEALRIETLRRRLMDLFISHGYEPVIPPLIEYVDSLLTGTGSDLDLSTFKLVDQLNGRMLGVRADITPQAARIDAHLLNRRGVARLCYAGHVLHTRPFAGMHARESMQVGAELFGHAGIESDIEVQRLMLLALRCAHIATPQIDLGHVGVFRALIHRGGLAGAAEDALFQALQRKDPTELKRHASNLPSRFRDALLLLPQLYGDEKVLREARRHLPAIPEIRAALATLSRLARTAREAAHEVRLDLGELRGYRYHSGVVFAAYASGWAGAVARGGRYDEVGAAFGRARPATGFSMDLRELAAGIPDLARRRILAPPRQDPELVRLMARLRARGDIVVNELPGHSVDRQELACTHALVKAHGRWRICKLG